MSEIKQDWMSYIYSVIPDWHWRTNEALILIKDIRLERSNQYHGIKFIFTGRDNEVMSQILDFNELENPRTRYRIVIDHCKSMLEDFIKEKELIDD